MLEEECRGEAEAQTHERRADKDLPKVDLGDSHVRAVVDPELGNVSSSLVYVYALHRRGLK